MPVEPKTVSNGQEKLRVSVLAFVAVLLSLFVATAYILLRLYQTSSQLVQARKHSFVQECGGKASILEEYLKQRMNDVQSILASQALVSYYHSKSLGMSREYGLSVAIDNIESEFTKLQKVIKSDDLPVLKGLALFDSQDDVVIAKSDSDWHAKWIRRSLFQECRTKMDLEGGCLGFISLQHENPIFLFSPFRYGAREKGYVIMELAPEPIERMLHDVDPSTENDFSGVIDSDGAVLFGPHALVGKNLVELKILPRSFTNKDFLEATWPAMGKEGSIPVLIATKKLMDGSIHLVTVTPKVRYLAGYSYFLWFAIVGILMGGLLVGLALVFKSYNERQEFFKRLSEAYGSLECRVEERTADLATTNKNLLRQIEARERAQEALKQSEERYRQLVESANDIIYQTDAHGNFSFVNPVGLRVFGYKMEDLIGRHFSELIPQEKVAEVRKFYETQFSARQLNTYYEFPATRKDGSVLWVGQNVQLLSEGSRITGFQAIARNITDRKRTEDELRWKEALLRHMAGSSPLAYLVVDHETDRILYFNTRFCELWGINNLEYPMRHGKVSYKDIISTLSGMTLHPDAFLESCASLGSSDDNRIVEDEIDLVGSRTIRRFSAQIRDDKDNYWGRFYLFEDVSERRKALETLRLANEFQKRLLSTAATAIVTLDVQRRITGVNDEFCLITGFNREEVVGQPCSFFAVEPCATDCSLYAAEISKPIFRQHCLVKNKAGQLLTVMKNADLIVDESGNVTGGIESFIDVTELTEAREKALAASVAKSAFLANMSHEIRTPINGIIGMTELALSTSLTNEQREYLELVMISADSLLRIINDILDFSKIEAGKLELESLDFNIREFLEDLVRTLSVQVGSKDVEVACHILPEVPQRVIGDYERLRQIVVNIMSNAIKFTQKGEVVLRVENQSLEEAEVILHFSISDTGVGIPQERLESIFKPFEQVDTTTTRQYGGTGLGLAIASRLVEMMGGNLWVESEMGKGSTFHFLTRFGTKEMVAPKLVEKELAGSKNIRVLVIDDNPTSGAIITEALSNWGIESTFVSENARTIELLEQAASDGLPFSVILLDAKMPGVDGTEIARQIRRNLLSADIPIVMMCPGGKPDNFEELKTIGVSEYIVKPIKQSQLFDKLVSVLSSRHARKIAAVSAPDHFVPSVKRHLKILLAEDNPVNQRLTIRLLEKVGHAVRLAKSGKEAVEAIAHEKFDAVLMDIQMPELDGLAATRIIREAEKDTASHIPIIALTAHAMAGDKEKCLKAGTDAYLSKPIRLQELVETIESLVHS